MFIENTGYHNLQDVFILFYFLELKRFSNKIPDVFCLETIYIISISSILFKKK